MFSVRDRCKDLSRIRILKYQPRLVYDMEEFGIIQRDMRVTGIQVRNEILNQLKQCVCDEGGRFSVQGLQGLPPWYFLESGASKTKTIQSIEQQNDLRSHQMEEFSLHDGFTVDGGPSLITYSGGPVDSPTDLARVSQLSPEKSSKKQNQPKYLGSSSVDSSVGPGGGSVINRSTREKFSASAASSVNIGSLYAAVGLNTKTVVNHAGSQTLVSERGTISLDSQSVLSYTDRSNIRVRFVRE